LSLGLSLAFPDLTTKVRLRSENTTGGQRRGDPAGQPVAFFVAAHIREHSLTLVLQQPALNTGVLAPEMASGHAVTVIARDRDTPWAC
jgi:hypothetical protein